MCGRTKYGDEGYTMSSLCYLANPATQKTKAYAKGYGKIWRKNAGQQSCKVGDTDLVKNTVDNMGVKVELDQS